MGRFLFALVIGMFVSTAVAQLETPFIKEVQSLDEKLGPTLERANAQAEAGDTSAGDKTLLEAADRDSSPAVAFIIANLLFKNDPEDSYRLHKKVSLAVPDDPYAALEWAMEQHRKGEYAGALAAYEKARAGGVVTPESCVLQADCFLRTGQLKEAVDAWEAARHPSNHTAIDFGICEIYGHCMPMRRRTELIEKVKRGDRDAAAELIVLDTRFETDWWNAPVFAPGLDPDLKLVESNIGANDPAWHAIAAYAKVARKEEPSAADVRAAFLPEHFVLEAGSTLPDSIVLTRAMMELAVNAKAVATAQLWNFHGAELRRRITKQDPGALHALCWLASDTAPQELEALAAIGWKQWKNPEFAASYLGCLQERKALTAEDPELKNALQAAPEDAYLQRIRMEIVGKENITTAMIVDRIKAEYRGLSVGLAMRDSYTLNGLFYDLKQRLASAK